MAQNLVSATLTEETKNQILEKLKEIREALNFLLALQPKQVRECLLDTRKYLRDTRECHLDT